MKLVIDMKKGNESINTEYGLISYKEWCKLEAKRIGKHASVVFDKGKVGVSI